MTPDLERVTVHISDDAGRIAMLEKRTIGSGPSPAELTRYIYSNHLQSATLELNEAAEVISYEEYHPYGTTAYQASNETLNAIAKRYRYTGKERDEESGLYYHGARYYIPWLCRWTACDPLEDKYAVMSPYNYCLNNPVTNIDSDGRDVITFHYFSSVEHINQTKPALIAADNLSPTAVGSPQIASAISYGWVTIEKNDSKTNTCYFPIQNFPNIVPNISLSTSTWPVISPR